MEDFMKNYSALKKYAPPGMEEEFAVADALMDAADLINDAMLENGLNASLLAQKLSVSRGYVSRLLSGNENITIKNVTRVLYSLGKKYEQKAKDLSETQEIIIEDVSIQENHKKNNWDFDQNKENNEGMPDNIFYLNKAS
jgi:plasmid maintenance system antidote protein VapI